MHDHNAAQLLAKVMDWRDLDAPPLFLPTLQLLADYKYDHYQRFGPGRRFIESLALWLDQFSPDDREAALELVTRRLVYFSDAEFTHLVTTAYPDLIVQERMRARHLRTSRRKDFTPSSLQGASTQVSLSGIERWRAHQRVAARKRW